MGWKSSPWTSRKKSGCQPDLYIAFCTESTSGDVAKLDWFHILGGQADANSVTLRAAIQSGAAPTGHVSNGVDNVSQTARNGACPTC